MNHLTTEQLLTLIDSYPTNTHYPMAIEHLRQCNDCLMKFRSFQILRADFKSMEIPEVPPGFATRVSAKVRERETLRMFSKPAFRIFRWTVACSIVITVSLLIFTLYENPITVPHIQIPAAGYYLTFAICLALIFVVDKSLSSLSK